MPIYFFIFPLPWWPPACLPAIGFAYRRDGRVEPTLRPVSPPGWKRPRRGGDEWHPLISPPLEGGDEGEGDVHFNELKASIAFSMSGRFSGSESEPILILNFVWDKK